MVVLKQVNKFQGIKILDFFTTMEINKIIE